MELELGFVHNCCRNVFLPLYLKFMLLNSRGLLYDRGC